MKQLWFWAAVLPSCSPACSEHTRAPWHLEIPNEGHNSLWTPHFEQTPQLWSSAHNRASAQMLTAFASVALPLCSQLHPVLSLWISSVLRARSSSCWNDILSPLSSSPTARVQSREGRLKATGRAENHAELGHCTTPGRHNTGFQKKWHLSGRTPKDMCSMQKSLRTGSESTISTCWQTGRQRNLAGCLVIFVALIHDFTGPLSAVCAAFLIQNAREMKDFVPGVFIRILEYLCIRNEVSGQWQPGLSTKFMFHTNCAHAQADPAVFSLQPVTWSQVWNYSISVFFGPRKVSGLEIV